MLKEILENHSVVFDMVTEKSKKRKSSKLNKIKHHLIKTKQKAKELANDTLDTFG